VLTLALYGLLAVGIAAVLFLIAAYVLPAGERIAPPIRDEPLWELPVSRRLAADDVVAVRLPVALRGYRFAETDLLLDRLADELKARDDEIARLRALTAQSQPLRASTDVGFAEQEERTLDLPRDIGPDRTGKHEAPAADDD
jgi:DivIVA domain-containing protein